MLLKTPSLANKTAIMVSLGATIGNRREKIIRESASISKILEIYPRLQDYQGEMVSNSCDLH